MDTENLAELERVHRLVREGIVESPDELAIRVLDRIDSNYVNAVIVLAIFASVNQVVAYSDPVIVRLAAMVNTTPAALAKDVLKLMDAFKTQLLPNFPNL